MSDTRSVHRILVDAIRTTPNADAQPLTAEDARRFRQHLGAIQASRCRLIDYVIVPGLAGFRGCGLAPGHAGECRLVVTDEEAALLP